MRLNTRRARQSGSTHEGGRAEPRNAVQELESAVMNCLLWEDTFYERGMDVAARIRRLAERVPAEDLLRIAVEAREKHRLRHVPLWLAACSAVMGSPVTRELVRSVVRRPDEMGELLTMIWGGPDRRKAVAQKMVGPGMVPAAVKRGLADVFPRFDAYQLAKWDRDAGIRLRDVMFLVHPKPKDDEQADVWQMLAEDKLPPADTWEVAISRSEDPKFEWERLLRERKLGFMALLMNLRNMAKHRVDVKLVAEALATHKGASLALPWRFVQASEAAPHMADVLNEVMLRGIRERARLEGSTAVVVDVSLSMGAPMSSRSQADRLEAAACCAVLLREMADARVFSFSEMLVEVRNMHGLGLIDGIRYSQRHKGTYLRQALQRLQEIVPDVDRVVVITDEQSHDGVHPAWADRSYIVNVAPYEHGIGRDSGWTKVNGFSDRLVDWIHHYEQS